MSRLASIVAVAAGGVLTASDASAQSLAGRDLSDVWRGKTVELVIGYPPGGGFDIFGRALAQHIGKHIPGRPIVVARNMPGASSLKALQYIATTAPRDGSSLAIFNSNLVTLSITDPKTVGVDIGALTLIGNMVSDVKTCFSWRGSGVTSTADIATKPFVIGGTSRGSGYVYGSILQQAFGPANVKIVLGYPSNMDVYLAMERGEVMGNCTGYDIVRQLRPEWIKANKVAFLVQYAQQPEPGIEDVPTVFDLPLSPEMKSAARFYAAADMIARPVAAPPGLAPERAAALRDAFDKTLADPEFHAASQKAHMEVQPMNAAELTRIYRDIRATPQGIVDLARKLAE